MPLIETKDLCFSYKKDTKFANKALDNINIKIDKGDFIGVIGHTGSGKSTLIQHLNALLKPTSGKIYFDGKNIWEDIKNIRDIRFKVGLVFQYPEYQLFEETVFKDIAFGPKNMGCNDEQTEKRVKFAAKVMGLDEALFNKSPFELSGGEKRKCAIAGVISIKPDVLLLDEPTAGLDPMAKKSLLNIISKYHKEYKSTVIFVSHNMEDIAKVCNKVIVVEKAKIAMYGKTKEVFKNSKQLNGMGLYVPQVTYIMNKLKESKIDLPADILDMDQAADLIACALNKEKKHND